MNTDTIKMVYHACCESVMKFGLIFWGGISKIQSVFVAQKRITRAFCKIGFRDSCRSIFKNLYIKTVYALYIYECSIYVFENIDKVVN